MSQAASRKLATAGASRIYAKRRRKPVSNRTIIAAMSVLSKNYGLLPCFCDHNPVQLKTRRQASFLSNSSNAFWRRNNKSKAKLVTNNQQQNNSTTFETQQTGSSRSRNFQTFRKSIAQRFKRNRKRKMPTITARSVLHKRTNSTSHPPVDSSNTMQANINLPTLNEYDSQHSSYDSYPLISDDNNDEDENDTLEPATSSFKTEQQNINATDNISRSIQGTSQSTMNDLDSSRKTKQTVVGRKKIHSNGTRNTLSRSTINSSKRKKSSKPKRISKRKTSLSNKKIISTSKRKNSTASLSASKSTTNDKKLSYKRSPFPNPEIFHSMPRMQNSDEITEDNVHKNHLCCKPITSVKGLSTSDQKKLIEHDYLTLISLLPIYLGSQGDFQHKIREKTNISHDGALELDRLMNDWGSTRLFIGANSHYKTLTQII